MLRIVTTFLALILLSGLCLAQTGINYEIRNSQSIGNDFEFDIYVNASQLGTLNSRGQLYIQYNAAAFGVDIVQNGSVSVNLAGVLNQTESQTGLAQYSIVNIADNSQSILAITWQSNFLSFPASTQFQSEVPLLPVQAFHITIPINTPTAATATSVSFNHQLMARQQYYVLANNNTEIAYGNSTSLPVELLGFTARKLGHDVQLDWATSMEINNSHFEIEKAVDGAEFVAVGKIAGQGTSESETGYDYLDQSEMGDVNIYRLKQVDIDGTYTYSESLEIRFDELASEYLSVYPVPAREHITVEANTDIAQSMSLHILDAAGKAVWKGSLEKGSPARIDITAFPAGVYLLKASSGSFQQVKQFVKID